MLLKILKEPVTTYQIAQRMAWDAGPFEQFDVYNKIFTIGETYSLPRGAGHRWTYRERRSVLDPLAAKGRNYLDHISFFQNCI